MRDDEHLVTIAWFDTVWEASIARGMLEGAGIRALVPEATDDADAQSPVGPPNATDSRLRLLERELLNVAERGASGSDSRGMELQRVAENARSMGLELPVIPRLSAQSLAEYVLRLRYCVSLVRALA